MADAEVAAARLLADWRTPQALASQGPAGVPEGTGSAGLGKIRLALALPPPRMTDHRHWSADLVPDRTYAERLDAAAALFSTVDKVQSPEEHAAFAAKRALLETVRDKDPKIYSHLMRVGLLAGLIAWKMGLPMPLRSRPPGARACTTSASATRIS